MAVTATQRSAVRPRRRRLRGSLSRVTTREARVRGHVVASLSARELRIESDVHRAVRMRAREDAFGRWHRMARRACEPVAARRACDSMGCVCPGPRRVFRKEARVTRRECAPAFAVARRAGRRASRFRMTRRTSRRARRAFGHAVRSARRAPLVATSARRRRICVAHGLPGLASQESSMELR